MRITRIGVKSITLAERAISVLKGQQHTVSDDRIGCWSEDAASVSVGPDNVARGIGHFLSSQRNGPGVGAQGRQMRNGGTTRKPRQLMVKQSLSARTCSPTASGQECG